MLRKTCLRIRDHTCISMQRTLAISLSTTTMFTKRMQHAATIQNNMHQIIQAMVKESFNPLPHLAQVKKLTSFNTPSDVVAHYSTAITMVMQQAQQDRDERVYLCQRLFSDAKTQIFAISNLPLALIQPQEAIVALYTQMMDLYKKDEYPEQIFELFEELKQEYGKIAKQQKLQEEKPLDAMYLPTCLPRHIFNHFIYACGAMARPEDVTQIISYMQQHQIPLSVDVFNTIFQSMKSIGNINEYLEYLEMMNKLQVEPNAETSTLLVEAFVLANDERYATLYEGFVTERHIEPTVPMYNALLTGMCRVSKDLNRAQQLVQEMQQKFTIGTQQYALLLECCYHHGDKQNALAIFEQMTSNNIVPDTACCNMILGVFGMDGDPRVFGIFDSMKQKFAFAPNVESYNMLIQASVKGRNLERAHILLKEMKNLNIAPNVISHTLLFDTLYETNWKGFLASMATHSKKGVFAEMLRKILTQKEQVATVATGEQQQQQQDETQDLLHMLGQLQEKAMEKQNEATTTNTQDMQDPYDIMKLLVTSTANAKQ